FYPAVLVAAIIGGFGSGLLAVGLTCLIALFGGPVLVSGPFIHTSADWLGMVVFIFNGTLMSALAEGMRRANARARTAMEHAEAANKAKSDFLATMSHELRTPLNSILGFSDLLRRDPTVSADQRADLDIINRSGNHLLGLINQVLDMAKIESGRTVLEPSPVDLPLLVKDVDSMMRTRAESAGLRFIAEVAEE
ncbi:MAG: hypothetical protein KDA65_20000, partial [Planctomycetaceae bacterium]|nr:hypothetical protein [Planctomycetaceae bacterium]